MVPPANSPSAERSGRWLGQLLQANRLISSELGLEALLRCVVETARDITGAQYAALGVTGTDGLVERFIHSGMDAETVAAVGELPKGRGLLGALLAVPKAIRLSSIADDPRSSGFPDGHPAMTGFLGVPIQVGAVVYGNLYLANGPDTGDFGADDEEMVRSLASITGVAIENARLYEQARRRQDWLQASTEISQLLLSGDRDSRRVLGDITQQMRVLAEADLVSLVMPDPADRSMFEVVVASGLRADEIIGTRYESEHAIAWQAMQKGHGVLEADVDTRLGIYLHLRAVAPVTHVMALPLQGKHQARGAIVVARVRPKPFSTSDLEMAEGFASQATLALELADNQSNRHRLEMLEDRMRIARDLHDHIVQRIFADGLRLQGLSTMVKEPRVREGLTDIVDSLDGTIRRLRGSIFDLQDVADAAPLTPRRRLLSVVEELSDALGYEAELRLFGPLDTMLDEALAAEAEAVLRESLTNTAKHAEASASVVDVMVSATGLRIRVADDGIGMATSTRRSGLDNLRRRAEERGGACSFGVAPDLGGLEICWTVPIAS